MDASSIQLNSLEGTVARRDSRWLASVLAATFVAALVLASIFVGARRIDGHLHEPSSSIALFAVGIVAATVAAGARWLAWGFNRRAMDRRMEAAIRWLPSVALIGLAAGVSIPGSAPVGLGLLWVVIASEEILIWGRWRTGYRPRPSLPEQRRKMEPPRFVSADRAEVPYSPRSDLPDPPGNVVQRLVRTHAAGMDRIQGWLEATFEESERNATLHVAFCPPFDETPTLTVVQTSGPECRIKTGKLLSYGVRLELKRALAENEQAAVVIEFSAQAPCRSAS
jgi:hypothetical protein